MESNQLYKYQPNILEMLEIRKIGLLSTIPFHPNTQTF